MKFVILLLLLISYNANAFNGLHSYKTTITTTINNNIKSSYLPINIKSTKGSELFGKSISGKALYASTSSSNDESKGPLNIITSKIALLIFILKGQGYLIGIIFA